MSDWLRRFLGFGLMVLVLIVILYLPIKVPYDLISVGRILPMREWKLTIDANGALSAQELDNLKGVVNNVGNWQFKGGDLSGLKLWDQVFTDSVLNAGDTLLVMRSIQVQEELINLQTNKRVKEGELQEMLTGEKIEILQESDAKITEANSQLEIAQQQYDIQSKLYKDGVIPIADFQMSEFRLKNAQNVLKTAKASLSVVNTGSKLETIERKRREIRALQDQIKIVERKFEGLVVKSPFDGRLAPAVAIGELLIVQSKEEYLIQIPIRIEDMADLPIKAAVEVTDIASGKIYNARIYQKLANTAVLDGKAVGFLLAIMKSDESEQVHLGLNASCTIHLAQLNLREYLKRILKFRVNS